MPNHWPPKPRGRGHTMTPSAVGILVAKVGRIPHPEEVYFNTRIQPSQASSPVGRLEAKAGAHDAAAAQVKVLAAGNRRGSRDARRRSSWRCSVSSAGPPRRLASLAGPRADSRSGSSLSLGD